MKQLALPLAACSSSTEPFCEPINAPVPLQLTSPTPAVGTVSGSLSSTVNVEILTQTPGVHRVVNPTGRRVFATCAGDSLFVTDMLVITPSSQTEAALQEALTVQRGTGRFRTATGTLNATAQADLASGQPSGVYTGQLWGLGKKDRAGYRVDAHAVHRLLTDQARRSQPVFGGRSEGAWLHGAGMKQIPHWRTAAAAFRLATAATGRDQLSRFGSDDRLSSRSVQDDRRKKPPVSVAEDSSCARNDRMRSLGCRSPPLVHGRAVARSLAGGAGERSRAICTGTSPLRRRRRHGGPSRSGFRQRASLASGRCGLLRLRGVRRLGGGDMPLAQIAIRP